jgi:hypothetical protein
MTLTRPCPVRSFLLLLISDFCGAQIKRTLNAPARLIVQLTLSIESVDELPFGLDHVELHIVAKVNEPVMMLVAVVAILQHG